MGGPHITILFEEEFDTDEFVDAVVAVGGVRDPDPWTTVLLARDGHTAMASVYFDEHDLANFASRPELGIATKLGAPPVGEVIIERTEDHRAEAVVYELIEIAAQRWPVVIFNGNDSVLTPEEVRTRARGGMKLFVDPRSRLTLLTAEPIEPERVRQIVTRLGGSLRPLPAVEAAFERGDDIQVWVSTTEPAHLVPSPELQARETELLGRS